MTKRPDGSSAKTRTVTFTKDAAERISRAVRAVEAGNRGGLPFRSQPRLSGGKGGGGAVFRIGQFTGAWPNEAGSDGLQNIKTVNIYQPRSPMNGPNDFVPAQQTVVAINLFSYIPTPIAGDISLWCLLMKIPESAGEYQSGTTYGNPPAPVMTSYDGLWLLVAAEC